MAVECGVEFGEEFAEAGSALCGVFGEGMLEDGSQAWGEGVEVWLVGEVSIEDFGGGFSCEGDVSGEQFVEDNGRAVDIDFGPIFASRNLGRHVVDRADAFGLSSSLAGGDDLGESDVTDFDLSVFAVEVLWFEVSVHNPLVVQVVDSGGESCEPATGVVDGHPIREVIGEDSVECFAADVFHDYPGVVVFVLSDVDDGDEVLVFEVEAQFGATAFDFDVAVQ